MRGSTQLVAFGLAFLAGALSASGCAPNNRRSRQPQTDCVLPAAQSQTLLARWSVRPIQLALQQGAFTSSEIAAIRTAADTWNSFFASSVGSPAFDYGGSFFRQSATPYPTDLASERFVQSNQFVTSVVIYRESPWNGEANVIAETQTYHLESSPYNNFTSAAIALNYQDYWTASKPQPDLQTILTHELGHLLGLKHSCSTSSDPSFPMCYAYPDFAKAVLRPSFSIVGGVGERVRDLTENDESRSNCLYKVAQ